MNPQKAIFAMSLSAIVVVSCSGQVLAQDVKDKKQQPAVASSIQTISGTVTAIGKDYIAVAYEQDLARGVEYEIFLPVEKNARIEHKRKLSDIQLGDTVRLSYEEEVKTYSDGRADKKRKATKVSFLSPAKKVSFTDEPESEDQGALNLKGFRGE